MVTVGHFFPESLSRCHKCFKCIFVHQLSRENGTVRFSQYAETTCKFSKIIDVIHFAQLFQLNLSFGLLPVEAMLDIWNLSHSSTVSVVLL